MVTTVAGHSDVLMDIVKLGLLYALALICALLGFSQAQGRVYSGQRGIPRGRTYEILSETTDDKSLDVPARRIYVIRDRKGELRSFFLSPGEEPNHFIFINNEDGRRFLTPKDPRDVAWAEHPGIYPGIIG